MKILIYDIEIKKGIPEKNPSPGVEYCAGWHDHANMGISVIGAYEYASERTRVFCEDNRQAFVNAVADADLCVGFNNINFDNAVIAATENWGEVPESKCYDLLREIWAACGFGTEFNKDTHAGYGLDAVCRANFGGAKTGYGGHAPVQWQLGKVGTVIDYCLNDIYLTKRLMDLVLLDGKIRNPKTGEMITVRQP